MAARLQDLDPKTLKDKLAAPLEDTQLATYALLSGAEAGLQAAYLVLDDGKGIALLPHENVSETAQALREGLQADLAAIRDGASLPALGEGRLCDFCEARGLCRRDDWASTPVRTQAAPEGAPPPLGAARRAATGARHD